MVVDPRPAPSPTRRAVPAASSSLRRSRRPHARGVGGAAAAIRLEQQRRQTKINAAGARAKTQMAERGALDQERRNSLFDADDFKASFEAKEASMQRTYRELYKPKANAYWTSEAGAAAARPRRGARRADVRRRGRRRSASTPRSRRRSPPRRAPTRRAIRRRRARPPPPPRSSTHGGAARLPPPVQGEGRRLRDVVDQEPTPSRRLVQPRFGAPEERRRRPPTRSRRRRRTSGALVDARRARTSCRCGTTTFSSRPPPA